MGLEVCNQFISGDTPLKLGVQQLLLILKFHAHYKGLNLEGMQTILLGDRHQQIFSQQKFVRALD
jgi:hypothetical protein